MSGEGEGRVVEWTIKQQTETKSAIGPCTHATLHRQLLALGLKPGLTVLVHSSLSRIGWVAGGAVGVVYALESALGLRPPPADLEPLTATDSKAADLKTAPPPAATATAVTATAATAAAKPATADTRGTLVMPAHCSENSEPSFWEHPPVPKEWWPVIRSQTVPFDKNLTPTRSMGAIAETFRCGGPEVLRSDHPAVSFTARGAKAELITSNHAVAYSLGETSPLARVYDCDGYVLLIGVTHGNNTSLHLAESRADWYGKKVIRQGAAMYQRSGNGSSSEQRGVWCEYDDYNWDDDDFEAIGHDFAKAHPQHVVCYIMLLTPRVTSHESRRGQLMIASV